MAGLSGAFVPFLTLYDNYYFRAEGEPCDGQFKLEQAKKEFYSTENGNDQCLVSYVPIEFDSFEDYLKFVNENEISVNEIEYEKIEIVEKEED